MFLVSVMTAPIALSKGIQNAHFLNDLAQNTSKALQNQENIDDKLEAKLNALEATVINIGNELAALKFRQKVCCHANYGYVCVRAAKYNPSQWDWEKVKNHLMDIWQRNNDSLDLTELHHQVRTFKKVKLILCMLHGLQNKYLMI